MTAQKNSRKKDRLSIIVPCYNEEEVIGETLAQLTKEFPAKSEMEVEFIFIDDGSRDQTIAILKDFAKIDSRVNILSFSRNFGHQIAVTAGIDAARGDAVVVIDADLQDPPHVIWQMIAKWREGYDVVYGTRTERPGETAFKLVTARYFYRFLNRMSDTPIPLDTGDFRLMSRRVVDALKSMPEKDRFIRGMVSWIGFKQTKLPYKRAERFAGVSKYPLRKLISFATDGILSFSTKPLKIAILVGIFCSFLSMFGILYALWLRIFTSNWIAGWTALMISVLFIGGIQLICLGIVGEYIGRIYDQIKGRPLYLIQERVGFAEAEGEQTPAKKVSKK